MSKKILITIGKNKIEAQLMDTPTARNIKDALPFGCKAEALAGQVIIETPVMAETEDDARSVVKAGELAFWADTSTIAIGYAKTPDSKGDEIRLAIKGNIWAHSVTDVTLLKAVKTDDFVFIESI